MSQKSGAAIVFDPIAAHLFASPRPRRTYDHHDPDLYPALEELLCDTEPVVLSIDVFDTLLLRDDKSELQRFWEVAEIVAESGLGPSLEPAAVLSARLIAARMSYAIQKVVGDEGHIDQILQIQGRLLNLPNDSIKALKAIELDYERKVTRLFKPIVELCRWQRRNGRKVVALTDMYLDSAAVLEIIAHHLPGETLFDVLISSADVGVSKRCGSVFGMVESVLGITPDRCLHMGDNAATDVARARSCGWRAQHLPVPRFEELQRATRLKRFLGEVPGAMASASME